ncbi:hypothetical protein ACN47E_002071 [Coniothyrium glycines]
MGSHDEHPVLGTTLEKIACVRLPKEPSSSLWDITIKDGRISSINKHDACTAAHHQAPSVLHAGNRLIAPSLCHAHVHIDKAFLLQDEKFSDLQIERGDFKEAMELGSKAKARFSEEDLLRRGRQLIDESIRYGVTAMRAFVEVDGVVDLKCLEAGLTLKREFMDRCEIQICAFAQLALFSGEDGGQKVRELMTTAASFQEVEVLGSTPYVEDDEDKSKHNVHWISSLALEHQKHLDLHLDYYIEEDKQPLIWDTISIIKSKNWSEKQGKTISLGHCTRLTRFGDNEWSRLRQEIGHLPVSFVGLPTSDLFIMRTSDGLRGTLPITQIIKEHGLNAAISVNNVCNSFTPHGNCDPLSLAQLGVGLYHAGTKQDAELLYETVSSRAKAVIGCEYTSLRLEPGQPADFVLFDRLESGWRCRKSIHEVVYDAGSVRRTIFRGQITSSSG